MHRFWSDGFLNPAVVRRLRLTTGIILLIYIFCHYLTVASGIFSFAGINAVRAVLLAPWEMLPLRVLLYGSLIIHMALAFRALFLRHHFNIPARDLLQIALGFAVPVLLISHIVSVRIANLAFDFNDSHERIIYAFVTDQSGRGLRQLILLFIAWSHAAIGIWYLIRSTRFYRQVLPYFSAIVVLVPLAAAAGYAVAARDAQRLIETDAHFAALALQPSADPAARAYLDWLSTITTEGYMAVVAAALAYVLFRNWRALQFQSFRIAFGGDRDLRIPKGWTVLEAYRFAGVPHNAICGGRGRCSTCRVEIISSREEQPQPSALEKATLERIKAAENVRLACQLRPSSDLSVRPVLRGLLRKSGHEGPNRQELWVAALFIDLHRSTTLAEHRMPYDALFIVDRFVDMACRAIREEGGHITSVAGDGIMCVFLPDGKASVATQALRAATAIERGMQAINAGHEDELEQRLDYGMGLHCGYAVITDPQGVIEGVTQYLGDVGNVASRIEGLTREHRVPLIMSEAAARDAGLSLEHGLVMESLLRGREGAVTLFPISRLPLD